MLSRDSLKNEENISKITTLIELRWAINMRHTNKVSQILNVDSEKLLLIKRLQSDDLNLDIKKYLDDSVTLEEIETVSKDLFDKFCIKEEKKRIEREEKLAELYRNDPHLLALEKNRQLIHSLGTARDKFLGIGTNKAKRRLNKLAENDDVARSIRIALETEDKNIQAKKTYGGYRPKIYDQKAYLINELGSLFQKQETWKFGIERNKGLETNGIIYFEIPGTEQISWHFSIPKNCSFPNYGKPWDGKVNSTLTKLEDKIKKDYKQIIY
jgi:hypothetical protein